VALWVRIARHWVHRATSTRPEYQLTGSRQVANRETSPRMGARCSRARGGRLELEGKGGN
jgi:hypothetical protein